MNNPLDNPIWQYALTVYECPEIRDACLDLQDSCGVNVNLLLFNGWLLSNKTVIRGDHWRAIFIALEPWQSVSNRIRAYRRLLRPKQVKDPSYNDCYQQVLRFELISEQYQYRVLWQQTQGCIQWGKGGWRPIAELFPHPQMAAKLEVLASLLTALGPKHK